ncbi:hypothetical protein Q9233_001025 [Columba guinea]|nr:hypothetical protein Q9233_001025 [Columba guinea]
MPFTFAAAVRLPKGYLSRDCGVALHPGTRLRRELLRQQAALRIVAWYCLEKIMPKYCWRKKGKRRKIVNTLNGFLKSIEFSMPDSAPVARTFMAAVSFALGSDEGKK